MMSLGNTFQHLLLNALCIHPQQMYCMLCSLITARRYLFEESVITLLTTFRNAS